MVPSQQSQRVLSKRVLSQRLLSKLLESLALLWSLQLRERGQSFREGRGRPLLKDWLLISPTYSAGCALSAMT
jgi:hypothetical protein